MEGLVIVDIEGMSSLVELTWEVKYVDLVLCCVYCSIWSRVLGVCFGVLSECLIPHRTV
jgi:hypothetical protein